MTKESKEPSGVVQSLLSRSPWETEDVHETRLDEDERNKTRVGVPRTRTMRLLLVAKLAMRRIRAEQEAQRQSGERALSDETQKLREERENLRRREISPTPEDLEKMKSEAEEEETYFRENPDLFDPRSVG